MKISGKKLNSAIKSLDITQEIAASKLGIARQTLSQFFKHEELSEEILQNVKSKLGIDLSKATQARLKMPMLRICQKIENLKRT